MPHDERKHVRNLWLAAIAIATGLAISGLSLIKLQAHDPQQTAQATPSPEPSRPPAESKPGGTRPTTPAPEPARPDPDAQKAGATPALPPAPPEKVSPPLKEK
jgi:hypothetical protein